MQTRGRRVNVFFEQVEGMDLPPIDQTGETIDVTCGFLSAKLHRERFICPGINRECIEYNDQLITPKTFYVMADKGSLKDWKNAIRINGKKMRRYIDSGELDFYNHSKLCTGRCKSRVSQKINLSETALTSHLSPKPQSSSFGSDQTFTIESLETEKKLDSFGEECDIKPNLEQLRLLNLLHLKPDASGEVSSATGDSTAVRIVDVQSVLNQNDDDVMFWRAIVQLGLVDEFFREVKAKLDVLKADMVRKCVPIEDAKKASRIVNELGMREKLDMKLCAHKHEFDRQRDRLEKEMEALKRKVSEYEQKTVILKQKSDCYEQLMTKKLKLDEIQSDDVASDLKLTKSSSPSSAVLMNGDSRSCSPDVSHDGEETPVSHEGGETQQSWEGEQPLSHDPENSSDASTLNC